LRFRGRYLIDFFYVASAALPIPSGNVANKKGRLPLESNFMDFQLRTLNASAARAGQRIATIFTAVILLISTVGFTANAQTQAPHTTPFDIDTVLRNGRSLESDGRWGEALGVYQAGLKSNPKNELLKTRRAVSRIHYDLDRRYSDASFIQSVDSTDGATAASVYAEVLLKIQSYYVDEPDWAELASYGLTSLEVALLSKDFRAKHLPNLTAEQVQQQIMQNRAVADKTVVNTRHDAYQFANTIARSLQQRVGLRSQAVTYEFICGAISALDPYSAFMSNNQYTETMSQIEGNFVGLGVELKTHANELEIVSVIPGGSADLGGLIKGDRIKAVDRQMVDVVGSERAADMLRGTEGSFVAVTIDRGNGAKVLNLERRRVEIPSVDQVSIVDAQNGVGYIRLTNFQKTTARDFDAALWKLHRKGMRSLIVDVRGNPGGLLSASVEVADRFVTNGVIVSTRGRNTLENYTHRANLERTWRVPLVVLVDENSASASEIFAAAIGDHKRGKIVGSRSYGKGSVQGIFPLTVAGGGVRLTTAKFFSPTGRAISEAGVSADYEVVQQGKYAGEANEDSDVGLRMGIEVARRAKPLVIRNDVPTQRQDFEYQSVAGRQ
jgi:carboxyl-terminal processing protease